MLLITVNNLLARVYQAQLCILRVINKINKICYAAKLFGTTSKKKINLDHSQTSQLQLLPSV
jgi:hypothetical protein